MSDTSGSIHTVGSVAVAGSIGSLACVARTGLVGTVDRAGERS